MRKTVSMILACILLVLSISPSFAEPSRIIAKTEKDSKSSKEGVITFDANGGDPFNVPAKQLITLQKKSALSKESPWRDGYTFLGWALKADEKTPKFFPGDSVTFKKSTVLYAIWENAKNLGRNKSGISLKPEYKINDSNRYCYTFSVKESGDYTVSFGCNEKKFWYCSVSIEIKKSFENGDAYFDRIFSSSYHIQDKGAKIASLEANQVYYLTISPQWSTKTALKPTFSIKKTASESKAGVITFDANGGDLFNVPAKQLITLQKKSTLSKESPWRDGYTFLGWALKADEKTPKFFPGDSVTFKKSTVLYAIWENAKNLGRNKSGISLKPEYKINDSNRYCYTFSVKESGDYTVSFGCNEKKFWYCSVSIEIKKSFENGDAYFDRIFSSSYHIQDKGAKIASLEASQVYYLTISPQWSTKTALKPTFSIKKID